jgi:hypothetical protein
MQLSLRQRFPVWIFRVPLSRVHLFGHLFVILMSAQNVHTPDVNLVLPKMQYSSQ